MASRRAFRLLALLAATFFVQYGHHVEAQSSGRKTLCIDELVYTTVNSPTLDATRAPQITGCQHHSSVKIRYDAGSKVPVHGTFQDLSIS